MIDLITCLIWLALAAAPAAPGADAKPAKEAAARATPADLRATRRLHLPYEAGPCFAPTDSGWVLDRQGAELWGDGVIGEDVGLRYWADPSVPELRGTGNSTILRLRAPQLYLHDLVLSNDRGAVKGRGDAIRFDGPATIWGVRLERVNVLYAGRNCLRLDGDNDRQLYAVAFSLRDCDFYGAGEDGVFVDTATAMDWSQVSSTKHGGRGFTFLHCASSRLKLTAEHVTGGIYMRDCHGCSIDAPHVESFAGSGKAPAPGIVLDHCSGITIGSGSFGDWSGRNPVSIRLVNGTTRCTVESSSHNGVAVAVEVDSSSRDNTIFGQAGAPLRVDRTRNRVID